MAYGSSRRVRSQRTDLIVRVKSGLFKNGAGKSDRTVNTKSRRGEHPYITPYTSDTRLTVMQKVCTM